MKHFLTFLLLTSIIFSCSKKDNSQKINLSPNKELNSIAPVVAEKNDGKGISIIAGEITTEYTIPNLNNHILGIEDDFFTTEPITECNVHEVYGGITISLPATIQNKESITVEASYNSNSFSSTFSLNPFHYDDKLLGFTVYIPIENKFWINVDGKWKINVFNNKELIGESDIVYRLNNIFYQNISDSPFDNIQVNKISAGKEYTYRFNSDEESIVVLYFSENNLIYYPVMVINPISEGSDNKVVFQWNSNSQHGQYFIMDYKKSEIPNEETTLAIFDSFIFE